jgi:hypothetical protein
LTCHTLKNIIFLIEHISGSNKVYDLAELDKKADMDKIFYKQRWINEDRLGQNLIMTFSLKYRNYQQTIRNRQVERAQKVIDTNPKKLKKCNANDYKLFISKSYCTPDGEVADKELYDIDTNLIAQEAIYDGFYAVCTNLEDDASSIIKVNRRRWEIEESFLIMKSEFRVRPVYLQRADRIDAHFTTCFISLMICRLLEKRLSKKYTYSEIILGLRNMNFYEIKEEGYIPTHTRTDFTDDLHDKFGFRTDFVDNLFYFIEKHTFQHVKSQKVCFCVLNYTFLC